MGQNFLVSRIVLDQFIEAAQISKDDTVVEVGPGIGTITVELAPRAKRIVAVEKDPRLIEILDKNIKSLPTMTVMKEHGDVRVVNEDIRKFDPKIFGLKTRGYKLIGNLPFYLANFVIRKFLESDVPSQDMTLIIQKEVAERICAKPPKMNLLAVSVQYYGTPIIFSQVPKSSFWPQPEVDAAILRIKVFPRNSASYSALFRDQFFELIRAGFAHPRKLLASNLAKKIGVPKEGAKIALARSGVPPNARAENLSVEDWETLSVIIKNKRQ